MDSDASDEYAECILKADVLKKQNSEILETFLWHPRIRDQKLQSAQKKVNRKQHMNSNIPLTMIAFAKCYQKYKL